MTDLTATGLPLDNTADTAAEQYDPAHDYHALNAMLNLYDADGKIQFDKDKAAEREYVTGHVATNSKRFASTAERLEYLISNQYYNPAVFNQYSAEFLDRIYEHVESAGFEFGTFLGAFKFYTSYALKTFDGRLYLEDFPQRCAAVALELAAGNEQQAIESADEMLAGRFQPRHPDLPEPSARPSVANRSAASWCASKTTWSRFRAASTRPSSSPSAAVAWLCC